MEGAHCYGTATCDQANLTLPVSEYGRDLGCSITGGYVYLGSAIPSLVGAYLFGDFCTGRIWSLRRSGGSWTRTELLDSPLRIASFGEDRNGEVYVVDLAGNGIHRLAGPPPPAATLVSPSGTMSDTTPTYTWNAVNGSSWYMLWVNDGPSGTLIQQWYTAEQVGCAAGAGTCSITPTTELKGGAHRWRIRTWSSPSTARGRRRRRSSRPRAAS